MSDHFIDSSGLSKRYMDEIGSDWIRSIFNATVGSRIYIANITEVEVTSALMRRYREGTLSNAELDLAIKELRLHIQTHYRVLGISESAITQAALLVQRHPLRAYDALQLSAAMEAAEVHQMGGGSPITFISADDRLNAAASAEGFTVDNPNDHP